jgi:L-lactate dehydrogenase complex protein LldG
MSDVLSKVRQALGRTQPLASLPIPPTIPDPITRLVHTEIGLPELFTKRARENKIHVDLTPVDDLLPALISFLRANNVQRLVLPDSPFLEKLNVPSSLRSAGFDVLPWPTTTLDAVYDLDAGLSDVYAAVAETGSLVVRASPSHGRSISLVPNIHIAIVQPKDLVPDLVDLFEKMPKDGLASATTIITGPSKTADIEMNLVMGVHGPRLVQVFLLQ